MKEQVSLDSLLEGLIAEGQFESAGSFTLSLESAREKLAAFLLETPEDCVLKLIQAGVALGARQLSLTVRPGRMRVDMFGATVSPDHLSQILGLLLADRCPVGLRHLALAINTAILTQPNGVALSSWDGQRGRCLEWKGTARRTRELNCPGQRPYCTFEVRRNPVGMFNWWGSNPEQNLVRARACWCPIPIYLNGRWLAPPPLGPHELHHQDEAILHRTWWLEGQGIRGFDSAAWDWPWRPNYRTPRGGFLAVGLQPTVSDVRSRIHWILDGVEACVQNLPGNPGGGFCWLVLPAEGLNTDLTGLSLVNDQPLRQRVDQVLDLLKDLQRRG